MTTVPTMSVHCDSSPFLAFVDLLQRAAGASECAVDLRDPEFDLVRVETDERAAKTGEISLTLYPSDRLLRFAAAFLTRQRVHSPRSAT